MNQLLKASTDKVRDVVDAIGLPPLGRSRPEEPSCKATRSAGRSSTPGSPCCPWTPPTPDLYDRLLGSSPQEVEGHPSIPGAAPKALTPRLWAALEQPGRATELLPASSALALFDPGESLLGRGDKVAGALVRVNPILLGGWIEALRTVGPRLTAPLAAIFRDRRPESERSVATTILGDYAGDAGLARRPADGRRPQRLCRPFPGCRARPQAFPLFQAEVARKARIRGGDAGITRTNWPNARPEQRWPWSAWDKAEEVWPLYGIAPTPGSAVSSSTG